MLEVIIYVNQPNVSCTLSDAQLQELYDRLVRLPGTLKPAPISAYGYRGMKVQQNGEVVCAYKEFVVVQCGSLTRRFHDQCREVERFLLGILRPQIPGDKFDQLIKPSFSEDAFSESYY